MADRGIRMHPAKSLFYHLHTIVTRHWQQQFCLRNICFRFVYFVKFQIEITFYYIITTFHIIDIHMYIIQAVLAEWKVKNIIRLTN